MISSFVIGYAEAPLFNTYLRISLIEPVVSVEVKTDVGDILTASPTSDFLTWIVRNQPISINARRYSIYVNGTLVFVEPVKFAYRLEISDLFYDFGSILIRRNNLPVFFRDLTFTNTINEESTNLIRKRLEADYERHSLLRIPYSYDNKTFNYTAHTTSSARLSLINQFLIPDLRNPRVTITTARQITIRSTRSRIEQHFIHLNNVIVFFYNNDNLIFYSSARTTFSYFIDDYHPVNLARVVLSPTAFQRAVLAETPHLFPNGFRP